jgi:hypothetical protein
VGVGDIQLDATEDHSPVGLPSSLAERPRGVACRSTGRIVPTTPLAPSTVGTWLRSLTFGHVRQLDRLTELLLARAWAAGAGPGDGDLVIDVDPTDL